MAGEHFTMADIPIGCEMHRWWGLPQNARAPGAGARWYRTVSTRPVPEGAGPASGVSCRSHHAHGVEVPMQQRPFRQIDVFSHHPGFGNPVAVVLDAQGLSDADMRRFAAWTNLSGNHLSDAAHGGGPMRPGPTTGCASFRPGRGCPCRPPRWAPAAPGCSKARPRARPGGAESAQGLVQIEHQGDTLAFAHRHCSAASPARRWCRWWPARWGCAPTKFKRRNCWTTAPCGWACCWTALNRARPHARPCSPQRTWVRTWA